MSKTPFMGIKEACDFTGLSQFYLRQGCKAGTIPHIRCGQKILVNIPLLIQQLNEQSMPGGEDE